MIYLMRVVPAQLVLGRRARSCCGRTAVTRSMTATLIPKRPLLNGRMGWRLLGLFDAGHLLELKNLKAIPEYRHHHGLPVSPAPTSEGPMVVSLLDVSTYLPGIRSLRILHAVPGRRICATT